MTKGSETEHVALTALRGVLATQRPDLLSMLEGIGKGARLPDGDREILREVVAAELVESELGPNDEPTPRGLMLEDVIDWLGHR